MDVVEIVTQKVREAVNVMSTQLPALIKVKLNEKADVSTVPTKVSDLTNDSGYQNAQQVEDKIDAKVSGVYRASDSASSVATLPALTKANVGRVSNMLNDFTTTADFVEGAGKTFSAGTNVVVTDSVSSGYKYDVLAGFVDLSGKQDKLAVTGAANKGVYVSAAGVVSPMTYELNANVPANFAPGTAAPLMDGTAAVGTSAKYAREDHRHPVDTSRASAADLITLVNYIKSMDVDRIASGNPATFQDAKAASVKALSVTLTPTQSGSGDPSPTNVRPITGASSVTVTRTGANGANPQTVTVTLTDGSNPLTVGGGTLDVTAGTLTVTHLVVAFKNLNVKTALSRGSYNASMPFDLPLPGTSGTANEYSDGFSDRLKPETRYSSYAPGECNNYARYTNSFSISGTDGTYVRVYLPVESLTTQEAFISALGDAVLCYPLAEPVTYQLTPAQLATLSGYNAVSSDAGAVDVTYKADAALLLGGGT